MSKSKKSNKALLKLVEKAKKAAKKAEIAAEKARKAAQKAQKAEAGINTTAETIQRDHENARKQWLKYSFKQARKALKRNRTQKRVRKAQIKNTSG